MYGQVVPVTVFLSEYQAREVEWLWPGRVPIGRVTLVCGDPGVGKSLMMMDIAARVTAGLSWPDEKVPGGPMGEGVAEIDVGEWGAGNGERHASERRATREPGSVLVMSGEDDPCDTLRPRIESSGGNTARVVLLRSVQHPGHVGEWVPELDRHADMIGAVLKRMDRPRLVVIDPLTAFMGRANASSNAAVRGVLDKLSDIAAAWRVAVVCVTHLNKSSSARAMYRVMGSLAFAASPRMVWRVERVGGTGSGERGMEREGAGRGGDALAQGAPTNPEEPGESVARGTRLGESCHRRESWQCRSVMTALKSNLGGVAGPIGFRIEEGPDRGGVVRWERASAAIEGAATGALEEACEYLEAVLKAGPRNATEVVEGARRVGISVGTLRRAKGVLGVGVRRVGEGWVWGCRQ